MTLTNRQRKAQRKRTPARPRTAKGLPGAPKAAQPVEKPEDRDGLEWLRVKGKLTKPRLAAAKFYRRLYRDECLDDGVRIKSNLDRSVGGEGTGEPVALIRADARGKLLFVRAAVLPGMVVLLDAVCGGGQTLRSMTVSERAYVELETTFKIALDLVALAQAHIEAAEKTA